MSIPLLLSQINTLVQSGQFAEAIPLFDEYLALDPNHAAAWTNYGGILGRLGRFSEALDCFDRALAINPAYSPALCNKGIVLNNLQQWEQSLACLDECVRLTPDFAIAHHNRGSTLLVLQRYEEALESFCHATNLAPDFALAHWNESTCRLHMGDYDIGWKKFEWRWQIDLHKRQTKYSPQTLWQRGDPIQKRTQWRGEPIAGKRVVLWSEQGFGDVFQFCRYVRLVRDLGATVILLVGPEVERLFQSVFAQDDITIVLAIAQTESFDFHCPLMSLPLACGTDSVAKIPANIPYLFADAQESHTWQNRLDKEFGTNKRRIGLVWAGGHRADDLDAQASDALRSLHLCQFAPLGTIEFAKHLQFYSLQIGAPAQQLAQMQSEGWSGPAIIDLTKELHDWADTAALIDNLDLVISCDTSVVHLAAAMGKPTWILSRYNGCWRWLENRTDSPWYPSVRLFRQPTFGDWETVMQEVARALAE